MARQHSREGRTGGEDRQQNPQDGVAGQARRDTGRSRQQAQEGQNQSTRQHGEEGHPGQQNDLAGTRGSARQAEGHQSEESRRLGELGED